MTRFHLRLYALPKAITSSTYIYPLEDAEDVSSWVAEARNGPSVDDGAHTPARIGTAGGASKPREKVVVLTSTAFVDSSDEASQAL